MPHEPATIGQLRPAATWPAAEVRGAARSGSSQALAGGPLCQQLSGKRPVSVARRLSAALLLLLLVSICCGCTSLYRKPVADNVISSRQLSLQGLDAVQHQRWNEAEDLFGRAVAKCAVDERARFQYAEALWRRGAADEAIKHMEEAVRLSGGAPDLLVRVGEMHLERGNLEQSSQRVERAIRADHQLASAWALQGDVRRQQGKLEDALASYHRALSYREHYPKVQIAAAEVYQQLNRPQRCLATLEALADQYPPGQIPQHVYHLQGLAFKALGRHDDAVERLIAATKAAEPTADMLYHLSEAQLLTGDPANARLTVAAALSRAPDHAASQQLMAYIESRQQRMAAAVQR